MKIKKRFQGEIPENSIMNVENNSEINTYSCKYINENSLDGLPIGAIIDYNGSTIPEGYNVVADDVVTLYNGGATVSSITLADDSSKFKRIKLICKCSTAGYTYSFESIFYPNISENGVHTLRTTGRVGDSYTYNVSENITISGNKITRGTQIEDRNSSSGNERNTVTTGIYIVKVIGYIDEISGDSLLNIEKASQEEIYSTNEIKIGTWIDGKNIYRKVFSGVLNSSGQSNDLNIPNIFHMINSYGFVKFDNYQHTIGSYYNADQRSLVQLKGSNVRLYGGLTYADANFYLVVEYTKTEN